MPPTTVADSLKGAREGISVWKTRTPPAAFPYIAAAGPRSASTRPSDPMSTWSTVDCPSGSVAGIPSTMTRMPRTPNCARDPKPRIEIRSPTA